MDQAHHLAWGFESVPPLISWVSVLVDLLGNTVFWVKFFPALFGVLTLILVWKTIETLGGNLFALLLGSTCVLFSALLRLNTLYQPNSFDVLCWTALFFVLVKYFKTEDTKWLMAGAVVFALGFLNKYNLVFAVLGLAPALLLTRERLLFKEKKLYMAAILALILILPNLYWQYDNNFPVIRHLNELATTQLVNVNRFDFLGAQLFFFIGSIPVILAGLYAQLRYKPFEKYRFFFWSFIFTLIIFMYFRAKDYYAIGLYPIYIAFGSAYLGEVLKGKLSKFIKPALIALPLLFFIPMYNYVFPNKTPEHIIEHSEKYKSLGMLRWEDGRDHHLPQDYADMLGWKELAEKVDRAHQNSPDPSKTIIICDNYGQAGAINFYSQIGLQAVSFNADYIRWIDLEPDYQHLIRIKNAWEKENEILETGPYFEEALLSDSIANPYARESGTGILSFYHTSVNVRERLELEIEERMNTN